VLNDLGVILIAAGSLLSVAALSKDSGRRGDGLSSRAWFTLGYRRQPRLWGGAIACVLAGLIFCICYLVVRFG